MSPSFTRRTTAAAAVTLSGAQALKVLRKKSGRAATAEDQVPQLPAPAEGCNLEWLAFVDSHNKDSARQLGHKLSLVDDLCSDDRAEVSLFAIKASYNNNVADGVADLNTDTHEPNGAKLEGKTERTFALKVFHGNGTDTDEYISSIIGKAENEERTMERMQQTWVYHGMEGHYPVTRLEYGLKATGTLGAQWQRGTQTWSQSKFSLVDHESTLANILRPALILERTSGVSLKDYFKDTKGAFSKNANSDHKWKTVRSIIRQTVKAYQFMFHAGVIYRNLCPENVLMEEVGEESDVHVKLSNFTQSSVITADNVNSYLLPSSITKSNPVRARFVLHSELHSLLTFCYNVIDTAVHGYDPDSYSWQKLEKPLSQVKTFLRLCVGRDLDGRDSGMDRWNQLAEDFSYSISGIESEPKSELATVASLISYLQALYMELMHNRALFNKYFKNMGDTVDFNKDPASECQQDSEYLKQLKADVEKLRGHYREDLEDFVKLVTPEANVVYSKNSNVNC